MKRYTETLRRGVPNLNQREGDLRLDRNTEQNWLSYSVFTTVRSRLGPGVFSGRREDEREPRDRGFTPVRTRPEDLLLSGAPRLVSKVDSVGGWFGGRLKS